MIVEHIVSRANTEDLMLLYSLAAFPKGDASAFLAGVARSNGMVKKVRCSIKFKSTNLTFY